MAGIYAVTEAFVLSSKDCASLPDLTEGLAAENAA
jgi:hypothetical protein